MFLWIAAVVLRSWIIGSSKFYHSFFFAFAKTLLDYWQLEVLPLVLFCIRKNSLVSNFYAGRAGSLSGTRRTCQNPLPRNDVPGFAFSSKQGTLAQFFHVPCFSFSLYSFQHFFYSYLVGLFPYFSLIWD